MNFKIVKDTNKKLRERSLPVELPLSDDIKNLVKNMLEYLILSQDDEYAKKHNIRAGVGLAAPQIGINKQMIAIYIRLGENKELKLCLVNPKIISESVKMAYISTGEGCLSVDNDHEGLVYRHYKVTVKAYDILEDKERTFTLTGFPAIVIQHEIDHLKGILYYDHIDKKNPFKKIENAIEL